MIAGLGRYRTFIQIEQPDGSEVGAARVNSTSTPRDMSVLSSEPGLDLTGVCLVSWIMTPSPDSQRRWKEVMVVRNGPVQDHRLEHIVSNVVSSLQLNRPLD